jgi:hypothetical protein
MMLYLCEESVLELLKKLDFNVRLFKGRNSGVSVVKMWEKGV